MNEELIRGDSCVIEFSLTDEENKSIELNDIDTLILSARNYPDSALLFVKNKKDFSLEDGIYSVEILPEDTQELMTEEIYYDIEVTLLDGTRNTKLGIISLRKDITTHKAGGVKNEN